MSTPRPLCGNLSCVSCRTRIANLLGSAAASRVIAEAAAGKKRRPVEDTKLAIRTLRSEGFITSEIAAKLNISAKRVQQLG